MVLNCNKYGGLIYWHSAIIASGVQPISPSKKSRSATADFNVVVYYCASVFELLSQIDRILILALLLISCVTLDNVMSLNLSL